MALCGPLCVGRDTAGARVPFRHTSGSLGRGFRPPRRSGRPIICAPRGPWLHRSAAAPRHCQRGRRRRGRHSGRVAGRAHRRGRPRFAEFTTPRDARVVPQCPSRSSHSFTAIASRSPAFIDAVLIAWFVDRAPQEPSADSAVADSSVREIEVTDASRSRRPEVGSRVRE